MPEVVYIQDMPVTKRIRRVTLRDLASADSCGSNASVHLIVRHRPRDDHPRGDRNQVAISSAPKLLSQSFEEVSWDIPDVTLKRGETYSFQLLAGDLGSCTDLKQRTWAHNASQVNGGDEPCARKPEVTGGGIGQGVRARAWHVQGQEDRDPECLTDYPSEPQPPFDAPVLVLLLLQPTERCGQWCT